ncbi:MAG: phytochelatin synthase family protein [Kofleriaceae bacterium]
MGSDRVVPRRGRRRRRVLGTSGGPFGAPVRVRHRDADGDRSRGRDRDGCVLRGCAVARLVQPRACAGTPSNGAHATGKGPWRWFSEDLLDCCVSLEEVRRRGLDLDEVTCLARCNGAAVDLYRAETSDLTAWRASLTAAARGDGVVIASYNRAILDQTGEGHFSPIGGYHAALDLVLVLDVARFKYPPHWIPAELLWQAMHAIDPSTGHSRGWIALRRRSEGVSLGFSLSCKGDDLKGFARRLFAVVDELGPSARVEDFARALAPLAENVVMRATSSDAHLAALEAARSAVRKLAVFPRVVQAAGPDRAEATTLLLIAIADRLAPARRDELTAVVAEAEHDERLAAEVANMRAQLAALWSIASQGCAPSVTANT